MTGTTLFEDTSSIGILENQRVLLRVRAHSRHSYSTMMVTVVNCPLSNSSKGISPDNNNKCSGCTPYSLLHVSVFDSRLHVRRTVAVSSTRHTVPKVSCALDGHTSLRSVPPPVAGTIHSRWSGSVLSSSPDALLSTDSRCITIDTRHRANRVNVDEAKRTSRSQKPPPRYVILFRDHDSKLPNWPITTRR